METQGSGVALGEHQQHVVTIHVNNRPVSLPGPIATGLQIKQSAISQGVTIQANFQLLEELGQKRRGATAPSMP